MRVCANRPGFDLCGDSSTIQLPPGQTGFSTTVWLASTLIGWVGNRFLMADCTAAPGACLVVAHDTRDPEGTSAAAPLTVQALPRPRGTASLDLQTPLVDFKEKYRLVIATPSGSNNGWNPTLDDEYLRRNAARFLLQTRAPGRAERADERLTAAEPA